MAAYLIANYNITNLKGFLAYVEQAGPIVAAYGGKHLVAGPGSEIIEGSPNKVTVVIEFPSMRKLKGWYNSPEYQAIIPMRTDNTEGSLVFANQYVSEPE